MDNKLDELERNIILAYQTGEKIRIKECIRLAKEVLLTDGELDTNKCSNMIKTTQISLVWLSSVNEKNKKVLAIKYKDISIEFYSID